MDTYLIIFAQNSKNVLAIYSSIVEKKRFFSIDETTGENVQPIFNTVRVIVF